MPTSFRSLTRTKLNFIADEEENLEQGRIWAFTHGNVRTKHCTGFCWTAPSAGCVTLEIWGAGGSGAKMCCCGTGIPGNPGAYSKRSFLTATGCKICGDVGFSCGNGNDLCFRGCSESTQVCWFSSTTNGCMCAQGGRGGTSYCSTGTAMFCCYLNGNFCGTQVGGAGCGIICNYGPGTASCCAQAYGGDVNCFGGFSCVSFFGCLPTCPCLFHYHHAIPAGRYAQDGGVITYTTDADNGAENFSGTGLNGFLVGLGVAGKSPSHGYMNNNCWTGGRSCGCYDGQGCIVFVPPGFPGRPGKGCPDVRDHGGRGGHGAVRIKFIAAGTLNNFLE